MATKHTPGPWTVEEYGDRDDPTLVIHSNHENRVCFMATPGSNGDRAMIAADARLISAAPDMLAALKDLHAHLFGPDPGKSRGEIDDAARAAIAKAGGE